MAHSGVVGSDSGADDQPAFGDLVDGSELLGEHDRVAKSRKQHRRTHLDLGDRASDPSKEGDWVMSRSGQQRVARPNRVKAEIYSPFCCVYHRSNRGAGLHDLLAGGQQVSELHGHCLILPDGYGDRTARCFWEAP